MKTFIMIFLITLCMSLKLFCADETKKAEYDPKVVELLKNASSYLEEDEKLRQDSVAKLIEIGAPVVPYLCSRLDTDNIMEIIAITNTLSKIGEPAVEELHKGLKLESEKARDLAMKILALIGSEKSVPVFKEALKDKSWVWRANAAAGLGKSKTKEARELLLDMLKDPDDDVRLRALLSLADMPDDEIYKRTVDMLDDPSFMVRFGASEILGDRGDASVLMLEKKLAATNILITRLLVIETLGNTMSKNAAKIIEPLLSNENVLERSYAAMAFAKTAPQADIVKLEKALETEKNPKAKKAFERSIEVLKKRFEPAQKQ
jgi:HEAT repeat protein